MSVGVVGALARKPPWRYLPEIHASRLSFSGSMRPKLGFMILCILLVLSVIAVLIPLVSKVYQSQNNSDLAKRDFSEGLLSEYTRHLWKPDEVVVFSPAGIHHLVNVLAALNTHHPNHHSIQDLDNVLTQPKPFLNNSLQFLVENKATYDKISGKLNRFSDSIHVTLTNQTLATSAKNDNTQTSLVEGSEEHFSMVAFHRVKLVFSNAKLTEERYYVAPRSTKRTVMYDIVSEADVHSLPGGDKMIRLTDLNGLTLSIVVPKSKHKPLDELFRKIESTLNESRNKAPKTKVVRIRIPIVLAEQVTQLGQIIRHLHTQSDPRLRPIASAACANVRDSSVRDNTRLPPPPTDTLQYDEERGEGVDVDPSSDVVKAVLAAKANVTHLASLQISQAETSSTVRVGKVQESIVCDHKFIYAVESPNYKLPLILGLFHIFE